MFAPHLCHPCRLTHSKGPAKAGNLYLVYTVVDCQEGCFACTGGATGAGSGLSCGGDRCKAGAGDAAAGGVTEQCPAGGAGQPGQHAAPAPGLTEPALHHAEPH